MEDIFKERANITTACNISISYSVEYICDPSFEMNDCYLGFGGENILAMYSKNKTIFTIAGIAIRLGLKLLFYLPNGLST